MRPRTPLAFAPGLAVAALAAVALSACGSGKISEQAPSGAQLFRQKCSNCHTLAEIGAQGRVGPNLDAIKPDEQRTLAAIQKGGVTGTLMPRGLFTGEDARSVSEYVAKTTGAAKPPKQAPSGDQTASLGPGGTIFKQRCGSCHVLKAAGTSGTSGPDLDQLKPTLQAVLAAIANGGVSGKVMPKDIVTGKEADEVAKFVSENAGK